MNIQAFLVSRSWKFFSTSLVAVDSRSFREKSSGILGRVFIKKQELKNEV